MGEARTDCFVTGASGFVGTNLLHELSRRGASVVNYDSAPPLDTQQREFWSKGDILDAASLKRAMEDAAPRWVIHLAARTDCDETVTVENGYRANTDGTRNVLQAIRACPGVERVVVTSSQYVCGPQHGLPRDDEDFGPHTIYGHSKVVTERLTRAAHIDAIWTIIRPVNIWGPWHLRYRDEFWRVMERGWYVHPGQRAVVRTYGYVGNVVAQLLAILEADEETVHGKVFYVGDLPCDIRVWVDGFSRALRGRTVRVAPRFLLRALGLLGDALKAVRVEFPITSSRYRSMIEDYTTPVQQTWSTLEVEECSASLGVVSRLRPSASVRHRSRRNPVSHAPGY